MSIFKAINLDKTMYKVSGSTFTRELEKLDPSAEYAGTELAGLDAYQRQLKRFDIHVGGAQSDMIQKFFQTSDSASLFPEYVSRAVAQGMNDTALLGEIIATKTNVNSLDYRSIVTDLSEEDKTIAAVAEGAKIPETAIKLSDVLVKLVKRGRMLVASYEAIKFHRLDLFTVTLKQIGAYIARAQMGDAVSTLLSGETLLNTADAGKVTYADLLSLWSNFGDYEMNTILASPVMVQKLLAIPEMQDAAAGLAFHGTGKLITPLGAKIIKTPCVADDTLIALDKRFALEMVTAGGVQVDYDKLIDSQLERAAITSIAGFGKIFPDAVQVMKVKAA
ncbi:phage major capsid protein [Hydrogenoanaerobacterium sp.]|uniref:phage major capsid protein n=1 Tax=Hydrogenoanaerobacterium sp. TaxID=2953763 RepID=UPI00289AC74D|nr:phage major capsid protein [Hydrogenoanaerobacterium sp.]